MASRRRIPPVVPPSIPQQSPAEAALEERLTARMIAWAADLRAKNLITAVALAQQAACGHGPLVDHFAELGRRHGYLLNPTKATRRTLRVIEGGST